MLVTGLVAVWCAAAAGCWVLAADALATVADPAARRGVVALAALPFQDALLGLCAAVLVSCVGWLLLSGTIAVAAAVATQHAPQSRSALALCRLDESTCPRWLRDFVVAALGAALSTGVASAPALAEPRWPDHGDDATSMGATGIPADRLTGLPVPDRATGTGLATTGTARAAHAPTPAAARADRPREARAAVSTVVVRPGQSLWTIAEDLLPEPASDQQVTTAWQRLHCANAESIGPEPDLILPGARLLVPDLTVPIREEVP